MSETNSEPEKPINKKPPHEKPTIAIFDLDETLTKKGTWGRFVTSTLKGNPLKWIPFLAASIGQQVLYMIGMGPREHVKEKMMRWTISGRSREDLTRRAEAFAENEVENGLRVRAKPMLAQHQNNGDRVIIASAAVDLICEPIAKRLGVDEVVCTATKFDDQDRLATTLGGPNCYGPGKLSMVQEYLQSDPNFNRQDVNIIVYSDSSSDLPLLDWADVGVAVNPSPRLKKLAPIHKLTVQDWDLPAT